MNKNKRKKISIVNILIIFLIFTLVLSLTFKNKENIQKMLPKIKRQKAEQTYSASDLKIGDIVYYNHKLPQNDQDKTKQTVTIEKGSASTPGYGGEDTRTAPQTFSADKYNTTWRVWDKLPDGRVMLLSNKTVARFYTGYGIGHIWWEHNAHKISSIFGYGYGADTSATKDFGYKVGSGIDDAPDMIEGDKGDWKIGQNGINVSGSRSLTIPEVEEKLGITADKIKNRTNGISINGSNTYGKQLTTSMTSVVQRDIGSSNQTWKDKTKAKAKNKSYKMTDRYYYWDKEKITEQNVPNIKYKEMLFNQIDNWCGLATSALDVWDGGSNVSFKGGYVSSSLLGSSNFNFVISYGSGWYEDEYSPSFRVAVYLQSKIKYLKPEKENNAWDIYQASAEDKNLKLKVLNLSSAQADQIKIKTSKASTGGVAPEDAVREGRFVGKIDGKDEYNVVVKKYSGIKREGTGDAATFTEIDNKYNVEITGIPAGYEYKIIGKTGKSIDLDVDTNLEYELIIYPKPGKKTFPVKYIGGTKDPNFKTTGKLELLKNGVVVKTKENVELKKGVLEVEFLDVELFDLNKNELINYTATFEKTDGSLHEVKYENGEFTVKYVPKNITIEIKAIFADGKNAKLDEVVVNLVGKTKKEINLLKEDNFIKTISVPERDDEGNLIKYKLEKKSLNMGYVTTINEFEVNLKPVLSLPFTGENINYKTIGIMSGTIIALAVIFRYRRKLFLILKNYTMMK